MKIRTTLPILLAWALSVMTGLALPVIDPPTPPNQTNLLGSDATFCVVATGTPPLTYQWWDYTTGTVSNIIAGATNDCLVLTNVQPTTHRFRVFVSDSSGSVASRQATLTVLTPPTITQQPTNATVEVGQTYNNQVAASGTLPLAYQWYFVAGGVTNLLPGKTASNLTILNIQTNNAGNYLVIVTNLYGATNSEPPATLSVFAPGAILTRMVNVANFPMVYDPGAYWGSAWVDYDKDGDVDLFVSKGSFYSTNEFARLYRNDGGGHFTRMTTNEVGPIVGTPGGWDACSWGDYDNDGFLDVSVEQLIIASLSLPITQWRGSNVLFRSNGQGGFTRIVGAGQASMDSSLANLTWVDYDNDGWLDGLTVEGIRALGRRMGLYHSLGDGTFLQTTNAITLEDALLTEKPAWGDYDGDGDVDLVITDDAPKTYFYRNDGNGVFTPVTNAITQDTGFALVPAWADYDNDGRLDLFIGHYNSTSRLFHNEGGGVFTKMEMGAAGQNAGGAWGDYDNDGDLDLFLGGGQGYDVRQQFFQNNGDGTFTELKSIAPATYTGRTASSCWGDYDNDGFLDLFLSHGTTMDNSLLFHNEGNSNHWLMATLEGTVANRAAIGAKVRVLATVFGKTVWQMREISGGNGTMNDMRAHFGLGDATNVETLRIEWPSGHVTELHGVAANQFLTITEPPGLDCVSLGGGAMRLRVVGNIGERYKLLTSTDVALPLTNWTAWQTNIQASRTMLVTNTSPLAPQRFHTAVPTNMPSK